MSQQEKLHAKQTPIKQQYKDDPSSALVTLKSSGSLDNVSVTCTLDSPNTGALREAHSKVAGLHPMAGGPEADLSGQFCSGDMLLEALVACSGVTLKAVASALKVPIASGVVRAEGDLDFSGILGVDKDAPVGFTAIRLWFDLTMEPEKSVSQETIDLLGKLTGRYCTVLQTIAKKPQLGVRIDSKVEAEIGVEKQVSWAQES